MDLLDLVDCRGLLMRAFIVCRAPIWYGCGAAVIASQEAHRNPQLADGLDWTANVHGILDVFAGVSNRGEHSRVDIGMGADAAGRRVRAPSLLHLLGASLGETRVATSTDEIVRLQVPGVLRCPGHCLYILGILQQFPCFCDILLPGLSGFGRDTNNPTLSS